MFGGGTTGFGAFDDASNPLGVAPSRSVRRSESGPGGLVVNLGVRSVAGLLSVGRQRGEE